MKQEARRKSLDRFFRDEYQKLVNFVRKQTEFRYLDATPEDILQDVAVSLYSRLDIDGQIDNIAGYIYRSLRNKITDLRRRKSHQVSIENFKDEEGKNILIGSLADELDEQTDWPDIDEDTLMEAIYMLPEEEQAILLSTEFEGYTFRELSQEWQVPVGTLLSRKHRALAKLGKILSSLNDELYL